MKVRILILLSIVLSVCCTTQHEYNITSSEIDLDTAELSRRYDSLLIHMQNSLLEKADTNDLTALMEMVTDSSLVDFWLQESAEFDNGYFYGILAELNKPGIIKDLKNESIHFLMVPISSTGPIELEISANGLLFNVADGEVRFKKINDDLWLLAKKECGCDERVEFDQVFPSLATGNLYRLDVALNEEYQYCWKMLDEEDILHRLIEEAGK